MKCVCCLNEVDIRVIGAPYHCSKCQILLERYFDALEQQKKSYRVLAGYAPIKVSENVDDELRDMLQKVNNDIESLKLELDGLQISVYNIGQVLSGRVAESK